MKKWELKTGDVVQIPCGKKYVVLKNCRLQFYNEQGTQFYKEQEIAFVSPEGGFLIGEDYDENLKFIHCDSSFNLEFVKSIAVDSKFFCNLKDNIQSNTEERFFIRNNDEFDLCMEVERFERNMIKIKVSSISSGKIIYQATKEWSSKEEIEQIFDIWLREAKRIKKKRFVSAQKVLDEIAKSSKENLSIKMCLLTQKLKKIYLLTDEEHEKVLNEIESEHLINVFQEYFSKAPFHFD